MDFDHLLSPNLRLLDQCSARQWHLHSVRNTLDMFDLPIHQSNTDVPRCPMECAMSSDAKSWSCSIEIRFEFDSQGVPQPPRTEPFGPTIEARAEVDLWIRRAQAAVLSPHRPRSDFLAMSENALKQNSRNDTKILQFSRNVVQVSVKDPDITDLNFVDLPGLT